MRDPSELLGFGASMVCRLRGGRAWGGVGALWKCWRGQ